jgi:hypothetical protein
MTTHQVQWLATLLATAMLSCGGSGNGGDKGASEPFHGSCNLSGTCVLIDTRTSADGLCETIPATDQDPVQITQDSSTAFTISDGETSLSGTIDGSCRGRLDWTVTRTITGPNGQAITITVREVREFSVDATGAFTGTVTRTASSASGVSGLPCTWSGTTTGSRE